MLSYLNKDIFTVFKFLLCLLRLVNFLIDLMNVLFCSLSCLSDGVSISDTQLATVLVKVVVVVGVVVGKSVILKLPCLQAKYFQHSTMYFTRLVNANHSISHQQL